MHFICEKNLLLNSINTVSKAVSTKTTIPILECILLKTNTNCLTVTANDLELGIESTIKQIEIKEEGSVALESKFFSEIIRKLPDGNVEIVSDENNLTKIKCVNSEYKIVGQMGEDFPVLPEIEKKAEYTIKQVDFKNMIRQTIFSISLDETKPVFTGELLEIIDGKFNLVSIDGYRVSFRKMDMEEETDNISAIIPGKTLSEINKILSSEDKDKVSIYFTDKHILFDIGDSIIVSRTIEGEFMNYNQIFTEDYQTKVLVDRKDMIMSIERASLLTKENKKTPIKIEIKSDKMIITSNSEVGTAYDEVNVDMDGEEIIIGFNPKYVLEALKAIDDDEINLYFNSPSNPCIIKPLEGDGYKYLVLPVRPNF